MAAIYTNPIVIEPMNFTPLVRTPWAGKMIMERFKQDIPGAKQLSEQRIGESWEFSCDPDFPSYTLEQHQSLPDLVRQYPAEILSANLLRQGTVSCEILVKLLNAAGPLSLQVHPQDNDPFLQELECGKPESWLILHAEPGAGLYLGFSKSMSQSELGNLLKQGDAARQVLQFIEVQKGDYFEIEPGVPHAIGPGVTLLEPQRILFGKSGKTYRLWDWGRKYDSHGQLDQAHGQARELHLEEALRLVDPMVQVGPEWASSMRRKAKERVWQSGLRLLEYPINPYYQLRWLEGVKDSALKIRADHGYAVLLVLSGKISLYGSGGRKITMPTGYCCLIPDQAWPLSISICSEYAEFCLIQPASTRLSVSDD